MPALNNLSWTVSLYHWIIADTVHVKMQLSANNRSKRAAVYLTHFAGYRTSFRILLTDALRGGNSLYTDDDDNVPAVLRRPLHYSCKTNMHAGDHAQTL